MRLLSPNSPCSLQIYSITSLDFGFGLYTYKLPLGALGPAEERSVSCGMDEQSSTVGLG